MTTIRKLALVLVLGALAAGACSTGSDRSTPTTAAPGNETGREVVDEGPPQRGGTLVFGLSGETDGWHPTENNWATEGTFVGGAVFETLMTLDENGDPRPLLAESLEANEDQTVWTIAPRRGVRFHDGTEMDAEAIAANLEGALFNGLASVAFEGSIVDVQVVDDEVEITMQRPVAVVPWVLAGVAGYIAAPSQLEDTSTGQTHPIGTGPFVFDEWVPDSHFRATRFDDYWQTGEDGEPLPYLDAIEYRVIPDDQARRDALESGEVDLILTTRATDVLDARADDDVISIEDGFSEETFVMLNESQPPFDNLHAREALAYGTDVESLVATTQADVPIPATSPFAPGTRWEVDDPGYVSYDPDRARDAVAAYEADTGESLSFEFGGLPIPSVLDVQQTLQAQWAELGIDASIETLDQVAYITGPVFGDYQAFWFRNYSFADPLTQYVFFHSRFAREPGELSTNFSRVHDDELDRLLERSLETADLAERKAIYQQTTELINEELVNIWLFHTPFALIAEPEVHGLNTARTVGFGNLDPKPWIGELWLQQ